MTTVRPLRALPDHTSDQAVIQPSETLLTPADLAAILALSVTRIYQLRHEGVLPPAIRVGRTVRWRRHEIDTWLDSLKETP